MYILYCYNLTGVTNNNKQLYRYRIIYTTLSVLEEDDEDGVLLRREGFLIISTGGGSGLVYAVCKIVASAGFIVPLDIMAATA